MAVSVLHAGAVHLPAFLEEKDQLQLYATVCDLYHTLGPAKHHGDIPSLMKRPSHRGSYLLFFETSVCTQL